MGTFVVGGAPYVSGDTWMKTELRQFELFLQY